MREPLSVGLKLAVTLKHLVRGDRYPSLQYAFRVARPTINKLVPEVCDAIIREYRDEVLTCPNDPQDWMDKEAVFRRRWHIPHALGHCPWRGGSLYQNYKGFHSIVLMALVEGDYQFLWVDVGAVGSSSDGQIFKHSELRQKLEDGTIGFPEAAPLIPYGPLVNYFILGDDAHRRRG